MHFRLQAALASLLCLCLLSCNNGSKTDREIIKAMEESLINSNKTVSSSSELILASLEDKIYDPTTEERAKIWLPKAQKIQEFSSKLYDYIEQLKTGEKIGSEKASLLLKKMKEFKYNMLNTDSLVRVTFESPVFVNSLIDSIYFSEEVFFRQFFKGASKKSANAFLSKLQNNVVVFENKLLSFCHEQNSRPPIFYNFSSEIISQSSEVVEPGKELDITAGIGIFSRAANPRISINNKKVPLNQYGVSKYFFKAQTIPGTYSIPIKISFVDQDGKEQLIETRVKYTVAKICD